MKSPFLYANAAIPLDFTICGVALKPFCLGHMMILEKFDSPFVSDDVENSASLSDAIAHFYFALLICAHSYEDDLTLCNNDNLLKATFETFVKNLLANMKLQTDWNIYEKIASYKEYVRHYTQMPVFQVEQQNNKVPSGIDWKQNIFTIAKMEFGYTETEILNMPLCRLFYEWCSYAEKNGAIRVQNEYEMELVSKYAH